MRGTQTGSNKNTVNRFPVAIFVVCFRRLIGFVCIQNCFSHTNIRKHFPDWAFSDVVAGIQSHQTVVLMGGCKCASRRVPVGSCGELRRRPRGCRRRAVPCLLLSSTCPRSQYNRACMRWGLRYVAPTRCGATPAGLHCCAGSMGRMVHFLRGAA